MRRYYLVAFYLLVFFCIFGCTTTSGSNGENLKELLVGRWQIQKLVIEGKSMPQHFLGYEFFADGTGNCLDFEYAGKIDGTIAWAMEGKKLKVINGGVLNDAEIIKITPDVMVLDQTKKTGKTWIFYFIKVTSAGEREDILIEDGKKYKYSELIIGVWWPYKFVLNGKTAPDDAFQMLMGYKFNSDGSVLNIYKGLPEGKVFNSIKDLTKIVEKPGKVTIEMGRFRDEDLGTCYIEFLNKDEFLLYSAAGGDETFSWYFRRE
jgi:hypothetical protein